MSKAPRGIPSLTYCRIINPPGFYGQGDILSDGNSITIIEPNKPTSRYDIAQVFERGITDEEVCELTFGDQAGMGLGASLNPITACVSDAVTSIIFIIGSKETKKWQFLKRTVLPFIANELFNNVADKDQASSMSSNFYKAQINLSSFEIQDECITDLLRPGVRNLSLSYTAEDGVIVQGLHSEIITDEPGLRRLLIDACDNRASHTLPPGGSIDTASAIFEFTIYQTEGGGHSSGEAVRNYHSRLLVVELPSTDPLVNEGVVNLRRLEGPFLHKSLTNFLEVTKKLNNPARAAIAPFRAAKLTHYLSELLGGNAIVVALGLLYNGEPTISKKTLELIGALNNAVHYPVGGKELTDILQGLLAKYRSMLMQLQDELVNRVAFRSDMNEHELSKDKHILQLQKDLSEAIKDRNNAMEDREKVFEMADLLRNKYATLMNEKIKQSEELAATKEDNVELAKKLLEKNIEFSAYKEETEQLIFDLNAKLLSATSHIQELDMSIQELNNKITELHNQINDQEQDKQVLRDEIQSLHDVIATNEEKLALEKDKIIELGSELLTLVNRNEVLQNELGDITNKYSEFDNELQSKCQEEKELNAKLNDVLQQLKHKEDEVYELNKENIATELEAKQAKLTADQLSLELREKLLGDKSSSSKNSASVSSAKYEELQANMRKAIKANKESERQIRRLESDLEETKIDKVHFEEALHSVTEKYRNKLAGILVGNDGESDLVHHQHLAKHHHRRQSRKESTANAGKTPHSPNTSTSNLRHSTIISRRSSLFQSSSLSNPSSPRESEDYQQQQQQQHPNHEINLTQPTDQQRHDSRIAPKLPKTMAAQVQQQLLDSYMDREKEQLSTLNDSLQQRIGLKTAYRELYDKYRAVVDVMEDQLPKVKGSSLNILQEQLKFAQSELSQSEAYLDELERLERSDMRKKFLSEQQSETIKNERLSLILATYQRNLEQTELKLAGSKQENIDLHIQVKQLIYTLNHGSNSNTSNSNNVTSPRKNTLSAINELANDPEYTVTKSSHPITTNNNNTNDESTTNMSQYKDMFQMLTEQIKDLKQQITLQKTIIPTIPLNKNNLITNNPFQANRRSITKEKDNNTTTMSKQPQQLQSNSSNNTYGFQSIEECLVYIADLESNHNDDRTQAIAMKLQTIQTKNIELTNRNISLEEELTSYQLYMKEIVMKYKQEIKQFKQHLSILKPTTTLSLEYDNINKGIKDITTTQDQIIDNKKLPLIKL